MRRLGLLACLCAFGCDDGGNGATTPEEAADRAHLYVRGDTYTRLEIEIDSVEGMAPRPESEAGLVATFDALLDKPGGVVTVADETLPPSGEDHVWTFDALRQLAADHFDAALPDGDTIRMHVMFVDGRYEGDSDVSTVLGIAWASTHVVMFKETIEESCGLGALPGLASDTLCQLAEESVWIHEVGHVIGLVDNGLPMVMDHKDEEHGAHDVNEECVMYWAYQGPRIVDLVRSRIMRGEESSVPFDAACLADIEAAQSPSP